MASLEIVPRRTMTRSMVGLSAAIYGGLAVLLVLIIAVGLTSRAGMKSLNEANRWLEHTQEVKLNLRQILARLLDAETGQRGFLYTGQEQYLEPYAAATMAMQNDMERLREQISDNPLQLSRLSDVDALATEKLDELAQTIRLKNEGKEDETRALVLSGKGKALMGQIRSQIAEMLTAEDQLLVERQEASQQASRRVDAVAVGGILGTSLIGIAIGIYFGLINRTIIAKIRESAVAISTSSREIAATVTEQERTAKQQSSATTQTSVAIEELSASSRKSAKQAENTADLAESAGGATEEGDEVIRAALVAMSGLQQDINALAEQIGHLGEKAEQIGSIASLLRDLSEQINILALNAALEAARAGEGGNQFSLVATEVRKLADRSKKSAQEAARLVTEAQQAARTSGTMADEGARTVADVTKLADKVSALFARLSGMALKVNDNVHQVMLNARQQSEASLQIVDAITTITAGANGTAAGLSQTKEGVRQLNEAAENLQAIAT